MNVTKLEWEDICQHSPRCSSDGWLEVTVLDYKTYHKAYHWLHTIRNQKVIFTEGVKDSVGNHTGEYKFRFLCKYEFCLFALIWS